MRPNERGGHLFEAGDMGVVRNALWQAQLAVRDASTESELYGPLSPSDILARSVDPRSTMNHQTLRAAINKVALAVSSPEITEFDADIPETLVVMGSLAWLVEAQDKLAPNVTSAQQIEQVCQLLAQFRGIPSPPAQ